MHTQCEFTHATRPTATCGRAFVAASLSSGGGMAEASMPSSVDASARQAQRGRYQEVTSPVFAGKNMLESHRMVYGTIADLMSGDKAPVHAVDSLKTRTP